MINFASRQLLISRQLHLKEMGIPQWYARFNLSGAPVRGSYSIEGPFSGVSLQGSNSKDEVTQNDSAPHNIVFPETVLPEMSAVSSTNMASSKIATEQVVPASTLTNSSDENVPDVVVDVGSRELIHNNDEICLKLYRSGQCLIVSESESESSQLTELKLLQNILAACDFIPSLSDQCRYEQGFNWPVFGLMVGQQLSNEGQCERLLTRWFDEHMDERINFFLYFGGSSKMTLALCRQLAKLKCASNLRVCELSHSLADLLNIPSRKADVWKQLLHHKEQA